MDRANFALAEGAQRRGYAVHLVAHRVDQNLASRGGVTVHQVPKTLNSYFIGGLALNRAGRRLALKLKSRSCRVVVNGGNCNWPDTNWVHYVHASWKSVSANFLKNLTFKFRHRHNLNIERSALRNAALVIANSKRTKSDLVEGGLANEARIRCIYYGIDAAVFKPASTAEKAAAREALALPSNRPVLLFVGALGDRRKGLDVAIEAWQQLKPEGWDALLLVIGTGREVTRSQVEIERLGLSASIKFAGFRSDVPRLLAACDGMLAPTRYEAYGLAVHEALCCGLPTFVTDNAGVAERFPESLRHFLLDSPPNANDLAEKLRTWRKNPKRSLESFEQLGCSLRARTWDCMAEEILKLMEENPA